MTLNQDGRAKMKTPCRFLPAVLLAALSFGLGACATDSPAPAGGTAATSRAPTTYRQVGSNIPVATPPGEMSDSERQRMNDRLTSSTGPSTGRG